MCHVVMGLVSWKLATIRIFNKGYRSNVWKSMHSISFAIQKNIIVWRRIRVYRIVYEAVENMEFYSSFLHYIVSDISRWKNVKLLTSQIKHLLLEFARSVYDGKFKIYEQIKWSKWNNWRIFFLLHSISKYSYRCK